jgi:Fe-S-cluster containining protein
VTADEDEPLDAGDFSQWLTGMRAALEGRADSTVPCGTCTACCTSSQFVHVGPDETDALAAIPPQLLFPAPGLPDGHVLMGYGQNGHCPMLVEGQCSIYEHRPRTCRTYDCRVFAAAGVANDTMPAIDAQARRWQFSDVDATAEAPRAAIAAAAAYIQQRGEGLDQAVVPRTATQLAVMAVQVHTAFLDGKGGVRDPEPAADEAAFRAAREAR